MKNKQLLGIASAVSLTLAIAACAPPPSASRTPVTSFPAQPTSPSDPSPGGGSSEGSQKPEPSSSPSQPAKPSPKPTRDRGGPTKISPAMIVGLQNIHEGLRDLPFLPDGAGVYQGPDASPPYADQYGVLVTVQIPDGADYKEETDKYVDAMLRQSWEIETFYPAHEDIPDQQYILTRGTWTATVTGRNYKGNNVITVSVVLDGDIR